MVSQLLSILYHLHPDDVPRTYHDAARVVLLEHGAVETHRAEEAELDAITRAEALAESRKLNAKAKAEAERVKARAARKASKPAKQALHAAA